MRKPVVGGSGGLLSGRYTQPERPDDVTSGQPLMRLKMGLFAILAHMKTVLIVSSYAVLVFQTKETTKNKHNTLYCVVKTHYSVF